MLRLLSAALAIASLAAVPVPADDKPPAGFTPLFNGKDLTGWVNVNGAPDTFFVKDGHIVTTGTPTGFLRTARQYENFELEMDWLHEEKEKQANSGLFVWGDPVPAVGSGYTRGIEVQVLVNRKSDWATAHGDLFSIWGADCTPDRPHPKGIKRCLPSEERCKPGGEWNHYKVIANDGVIKLHVNGKEVSGVSKCTPRKGYLALESEGSVCHFKNLWIKELPSTNPKPEEVADEARGFTTLFDGLTLTGWKAEAGAWKPTDGVFKATGTTPLATAKPLPAGELFFDWKVPGKDETTYAVQTAAGETKVSGKAGSWNRATLTLKDGDTVTFPAAPGLEIRNIFARVEKLPEPKGG